MGTLLETIHSPADLKSLNFAQMGELAEEIREYLIQTLSKTGGHLGPNLGVVELTLALHTVFNTPGDKLVFDVSHQAYVHKILTGRLDRMNTIRQPGGLNGFMLRTESEHDCYGAGHAGTAISAALGMAVARDLAGGDQLLLITVGAKAVLSQMDDLGAGIGVLQLDHVDVLGTDPGLLEGSPGREDRGTLRRCQ